MSFQILDIEKQGFITIRDIKRMIVGIVTLWNWAVDSTVKCNDEYINNFFMGIDDNKDGKISK